MLGAFSRAGILRSEREARHLGGRDIQGFSSTISEGGEIDRTDYSPSLSG